jgi:hypothetical protein
MSHKVGSEPKLVKRNKEGHLLLIKETIHEKEIAVVNLYASNVGAPNFIK